MLPDIRPGGEMAGEIATGANAQNLAPIKKTPKFTAFADSSRSMIDMAEGARKVLNHTENNGTEDRIHPRCPAVRTERPTGRRLGNDQGARRADQDQPQHRTLEPAN